jgi:hypothetical protein
MTGAVFPDLQDCPSDILNAAAEAVEGLPNRPPFPADILLAIAKAAFAERKEILRYKSMFDDAVAQHNAQMERAEKAEADRDEARQIVRDIHWMARRYASGRHTYAPSMFNDAIGMAVSGGWLTADNVAEPLLADDPIDGAASITKGTHP